MQQIFDKAKRTYRTATSHLQRAVRAVEKLQRHSLHWFETRPRPAQLILVVLTVLGLGLFIDETNKWQVWHQLFYPHRSSPAEVSFWSALVYNLVLAMGLPVAFLVWHWRDRNARDQIEQQRRQVENARKDTNLKEFLEVQGRAVGLFDEKMSQGAREQLQIAALHQLRGFLRGEYGDAFRRPAFELILAGHAEAMDRIGMRLIQKKFSQDKLKPDRKAILQIREEKSNDLDRVMKERIGIIRDEAKAIFESGFPLTGRTWDFCDFQGIQVLNPIRLDRGRFLFANFWGAQFEAAGLRFAHLDGATLSRARLERADFAWASLQGADLSGSILTNADFTRADLRQCYLNRTNLEESNLFRVDLSDATLSIVNLDGADLSHSSLLGTTIIDVKFYNAKLVGAEFDDTTKFQSPWQALDENSVISGQNLLRERGAHHVKDHTSDKDIPF